MALRWCGLTSDPHLIEPHVTHDTQCVSAVAVGSELVCLKQCFLGFWWVASVSSYHVCGCKSDCVKSTVSPFFPWQKQKCLVGPVFFFLFEVMSASQCWITFFFLSRLSIFAYLEIKSVRSTPNSCDHKGSTTRTLQRGTALTHKAVCLKTRKCN